MHSKIGAKRLGFGCASIPGSLTKREALTLLETAYACGIRHFDTARMYCSGESEAVLGELVRRRYDDLVLVSKAGIWPNNRFRRAVNKLTGKLRLPQFPPPHGRFAPAQVRRSVEISLRKLGADRLTALLLHEVRSHDIRDDLKRELERLREEGKIGVCGIATSVQQTEAIIVAHPDLCAVVQVPASWLDSPRTLPDGATLILHSLLGARLAAFVGRLQADPELSALFHDETGLTAADHEDIGRLMLQATMARNPNGVTLFSTAKPYRLRRNADIMSVRSNISAIETMDRMLHPSQYAREDQQVAK